MLIVYRGFAIGWDYAIAWLIILPFELIAAGLTIRFWREDINIGVWITVFLVLLTAIQFFGVRGYGEGEFLCRLIKLFNHHLQALYSTSRLKHSIRHLDGL